MSFASSSRVKQRTRTEGRVKQASGDGKVGRDSNVVASESSHEVLSVVGRNNPAVVITIPYRRRGQICK